MISYIKGPLIDVWEDAVVVEAGSIGYRIFVPVPVIEKLPRTGGEVMLYTHFHVREDGMSLYGFLSRQDLDMFRLLIGVSGIGPKGALAILSALRPEELRLAIFSGDIKMISTAPGVGKKTAQRMILDLKDKIEPSDILPGGHYQSSCAAASVFSVRGAAQDAAEALTALGYSPGEAVRAVQKVPVTEGMSVEEVLKAALKHMTF